MSDSTNQINIMIREYLTHMRRFGLDAEFPLEEFYDFQFNNRARQISERIIGDTRSRGVPALFKELFALNRKRSVKRACREITIRGRDLSDLIFNADMIGYRHSRVHREYIPEETIPTPQETTAFRQNGVGSFKSKGAKSFVKKIGELFEKRKNVNGHLFVNGSEWHLLYFTYRDAFGTQMQTGLHWSGGDHVHYISYLWGHDIGETWRRIQEPHYSLNGCHIRYVDNDRSEPTSG